MLRQCLLSLLEVRGLDTSTRTYSVGSSTLRAQSNHKQPGSLRVAAVNPPAICGHRSAYSGRTRNLAVMKIIDTSHRLRGGRR